MNDMYHNIAETIDQLIAAAKLKPLEERVLVLRFGLRGQERKKLNEVIAILQADESVERKTLSREWVRRTEARALVRLRSALGTLQIDTEAFRELSREEPYTTLCEVLLGT